MTRNSVGGSPSCFAASACRLEAKSSSCTPSTSNVFQIARRTQALPPTLKAMFMQPSASSSSCRIGSGTRMSTTRKRGAGERSPSSSRGSGMGVAPTVYKRLAVPAARIRSRLRRPTPAAVAKRARRTQKCQAVGPMPLSKIELPHPLILLLAGVATAAALTWLLPAGAFDRRDDPATGRRVVVAGTYHAVARAPVGPCAAAVAMPRGFVAAAAGIAVVLFVGGAWVVVDRIGTLPALVAVLVTRFRRRGLWAIPVICVFFAAMGALENMQEEIIPLVPVLLVLGQGLGVDAVAVVAMSAGAAMIGSAFGPTNPFQAGIALKLAQLPPVAGGALRLVMFAAGVGVWV